MLAFNPSPPCTHGARAPYEECMWLRASSIQPTPFRGQAGQLPQFADATSLSSIATAQLSSRAIFDPRGSAFSHSRLRASSIRRLRVEAISPGDAARWDGGRDGDGDQKLQQLLVDLVRVQCGEIRMTSLVEERQRRLRRIGVDSAEELNRITHRAMKGVDELSNRVSAGRHLGRAE